MCNKNYITNRRNLLSDMIRTKAFLLSRLKFNLALVRTLVIKQRSAQGRSILYNTEDVNADGRLRNFNGEENMKVPTMGFNAIFQSLALYILPKGFPNSVGPRYDRYIAFQAIDSISGTICGVLAMQSLFFAAGVTGSGSIPLAASLNWILKDGLGQIGGVVFAGVVSNRFDAEPKKWRLVASLSMSAASILELTTPVFPGYFLAIASIANVGKNIAFLAASASRAAIHRSFAIRENLADLTAKAGSQAILCSSIGTAIGVALAANIGGDYANTVLAFICFASINATSTYMALRQVHTNKC